MSDVPLQACVPACLLLRVSRCGRCCFCRDWYFIAEQPTPVPHLARPEGRSVLTHMWLLLRLSRTIHQEREEGEREGEGERGRARARERRREREREREIEGGRERGIEREKERERAERGEARPPRVIERETRHARVRLVLTRRGRVLFQLIDSGLVGRVPREQKMLKGHLPRVIYHQVY